MLAFSGLFFFGLYITRQNFFGGRAENVVVGREILIDRIKKGDCFFVLIYCGFCGHGEYLAVVGEINFGGFLIVW